MRREQRIAVKNRESLFTAGIKKAEGTKMGKQIREGCGVLPIALPYCRKKIATACLPIAGLWQNVF